MQINNNYSLNFTGAFWVGPAETKAIAEIPQKFVKNKQIFRNILKDGDLFITLRDTKDKQFYRYIKDNNVQSIIYYPTINTRSGLDNEKPEVLQRMLASGQHRPLSNLKDIGLRLRQTGGFSCSQEVQEKVTRVADCMRLNIENPKVKTSAKWTEVRDEAKQRTLYVISPNPSINYAYLRYDNPNMHDSIRCTIDNNGKIIKNYEEIKDIFAFNKKFSKLAGLSVNTLK